jgi:hypothetical protein
MCIGDGYAHTPREDRSNPPAALHPDAQLLQSLARLVLHTVPQSVRTTPPQPFPTATGEIPGQIGLDRVSVLLGHRNVRITEKHYPAWVRERQEQLE